MPEKWEKFLISKGVTGKAYRRLRSLYFAVTNGLIYAGVICLTALIFLVSCR